MSHAVVRGSPVPAQRYLDAVLDAVLQDGGSRGGGGGGGAGREGVTLAELLYYCLRTNPGAIHSINAETGENFTNERILKRAVSLARALASYSTETVILMLQNHERMSALYYAVLLAGVVPFMMAPGPTEDEIRHFITLVSPRLIFCEADRRDDVLKALRSCDVRAEVVVADEGSLDDLLQGHNDDIDSFQVPELGVGSTALMLSTSGSTGLPKVTMLNHQGLVMQIASPWQHDSKFPQPTRLVMLVSTAQWITHTILMCSCPVLQVPILMSPVKMTAERIVGTVEIYRPTWIVLDPAAAMQLGHFGTPEQLSSFNTLHVGGTFFTPETVAALKNKLPPSANLLNSYGLTEVHGLVALGRNGTLLTTSGTISNIFEYKIVNGYGEDVLKPYEKGELYLKSKCIFQGYLNNEAVYQETVTADGWMKTGDIFYKNEEEQIFFVSRCKLGFKYKHNNVSAVVYPEEVERVINSIPGVQQCVVCNSFCKENGVFRGPTAAIVLRKGCDVNRESVHQIVNSTLSDKDRVHGGIAFVSALPTNCNNKLDRTRCFQLIQELVANGECF